MWYFEKHLQFQMWYDPKQKLKPCKIYTLSCFSPARLKIFQQVFDSLYNMMTTCYMKTIIFITFLKYKTPSWSLPYVCPSVHQATKDTVAAELRD